MQRPGPGAPSILKQCIPRSSASVWRRAVTERLLGREGRVGTVFGKDDLGRGLRVLYQGLPELMINKAPFVPRSYWKGGCGDGLASLACPTSRTGKVEDLGRATASVLIVLCRRPY